MPIDDGMATPRLTWELPHRVRVAYSTRADGDQHDPLARSAFLSRLGLSSAAHLRQVHGISIIEADRCGALGSGDALIGDGAIPLIAFGADCPGIVIAAPDILGTAHAGWRGAAAGIATILARQVASRSHHRADSWTAFIGPGISQERYEVDAPVLAARVWPASALGSARTPDRRQLDLAEALACDLRAAGIDRIIRSAVCTASQPGLYSFRRDGGGASPSAVQALVAWRI